MYRTIDASFWTDAKVKKLGVHDRLLFLYLITNPHTHVSGLYYLPLPIAEHETGLHGKVLRYGIDTLSRVGLCRFDFENELVWVIRMFRFQGTGPKNTLSVAYHISKDIHNSFLVNEFLETYPEVKPHIKYRVSICYPTQSCGATPEQEQEQEQEYKYKQDSGFLIPDTRVPIPKHGKFTNVMLTDTELEKLEIQFGKEGAADRIEALSAYIASKGVKYKSHFATILTWERKNNANAKGQKPVHGPVDRNAEGASGVAELRTAAREIRGIPDRS